MLLLNVIVAAQISLLLIDAIVTDEYLWLLILAFEFTDCQVHKIGTKLCFYFTVIVVSKFEIDLEEIVQRVIKNSLKRFKNPISWKP